jgi:3-hydroxymyristoyl/3-hydroxydecanoyl-(acyl carrier protein) dehydratase
MTDNIKIMPYSKDLLYFDDVIEKTDNTIRTSFYFKDIEGHFKDFSIMPGIYLIEGMAQSAAYHVYSGLDHPRNYLLLLCCLKNVEFMQPVLPMSKIEYFAQITQDGKRYNATANAKHRNYLVARSEITAVLVNKKKFILKYGAENEK